MRGMICISPNAPTPLCTSGCKLDSTAITANTTSNVTAAKKKKTKKFAGVEDPPDYGAGLFTIPDAEDEDDDDEDELFAHSLNKGLPRREKMGRRDSGDSAYICLLYTSPSPRDISGSRMPSSA